MGSLLQSVGPQPPELAFVRAGKAACGKAGDPTSDFYGAAPEELSHGPDVRQHAPRWSCRAASRCDRAATAPFGREATRVEKSTVGVEDRSRDAKTLTPSAPWCYPLSSLLQHLPSLNLGKWPLSLGYS